MSRILVSGSLAYDRIMDFPGLFKDHFLQDKLHNINVSFGVEGVEQNFGGCAGNIAYNLSLLGQEPTIISTAGSDFSTYKAYLEKIGIATSQIHIDGNDFTSAAYILTDKADNQIAAFSFGAGKKKYEPLPDTKGVACAILGAGSLDDLRALPAYYREKGLSYFYDPAQEIPLLSADELKDGIEGAAGVFGNDYEFGLITEKTGWDEKTIAQKAGMAVITYGEKGSRVATKDGETKVEAAPIKEVVDPTGAGDAFRAGFIAAHLAGQQPKVCAQAGSIAAAYAVEHYGTQNHTFTLEEFKKRYQEAYGETCPL